MKTHDPRFVPPFCPEPGCRHHRHPEGRWWARDGSFQRRAQPRCIRRFRCTDCRRCFSTQTFDTTYWLKRPDLQVAIFLRLVECGCFRQIARGLGVVHSTVQHQSERLGRHCLLFQWMHRPSELPGEALVLDGLRSFEYSQYWPCDLNLLLGGDSHFLHGFTDAELRRSGRMKARQARERQRLERRFGRPDPKATERAVEELLRIYLPEGRPLRLHTDEHAAYPRALRRLTGHRIEHVRTSSKAARTCQNPLWPANLADLLVRHSGANQKRETIAFSKRRQSALERLAVFQVWRNFLKPFAEQRPWGRTAAMRAGVVSRRFDLDDDVLHRRLFPSLVELPARLFRYYVRDTPTRQVPDGRRHELRYAF